MLAVIFSIEGIVVGAVEQNDEDMAGVPAVSGATYSSKGIMAAVQDALAKAENG